SAQQIATDTQGHFEFLTLEPGVFRLTAEAPGFQTVSRETAVLSARATKEALQFQSISSTQEITVVASAPDAMSPDPSLRTFVHDQLLEANPGRPGAPISIPGIPIETASGGIKAPQYFAPG